MKERKMKVLFASSECAPFFKTGGLGDVAGALPKELAKKSEIDSVAVILPYFKNEMKEEYRSLLKDEFYDFVDVGWRHEYVGVKSLEKEGVKYYFLDNEHYFGRGQLYGYGDDGERFAFFDLALCQLLEKLDFIPDVLHVNDWQTAMVPFLLKEKYNWIKAYEKIKTVLTIHNIEFQGLMHGDALSELFGMGMERLLLILEKQGVALPLETGLDAYIAVLGEAANRSALELVQALRNQGYVVERDYLDRKLKAQFKSADAFRAKTIITLGESEIESNQVTVKNNATRQEVVVGLDQVQENYQAVLEELGC